MYSFLCKFYPGDCDAEIYEQLIYGYLAAINSNGQTVGSEWNLALAGDHYEFPCMALEEDSLSVKRHDSFASMAYEGLMSGSAREPECALVGRVAGLEEACGCKSPSGYVLFTTCVQVGPPVICRDCGGLVPLYRLPYGEGETEGYWAIQGWEAVCQSCDMLYMQSGVGEKFGWGQIRDPKSKLTEQGLAVCKEMSGRAGKPFYYFLATSCERTAKRCPSCGADWLVEEPMAGRFDMVCEKCGFVSMGPG